MYAVDLLGLVPIQNKIPQLDVNKSHPKFVSYILNKEFNYSQKDIALALSTTTTKIGAFIRDVDLSIRNNKLYLGELDKARILLFALGYKKLNIDVRSIVYQQEL